MEIIMNNRLLLYVGGGPVIVKTTIPSGRLIYRHSSNMGSVIEFTDNKKRKVLVLDARYRGTATFAAETISGATQHSPNWILSDYGTVTQLTDTTINKIVIDSKTSEDLTTLWVAKNCAAAKFCRNIPVPGYGVCDLPNMQTLIRLCCDANSIDDLDPTVTSYSKYALGSKNPNGAFSLNGTNYNWSSSAHVNNYRSYQTAMKYNNVNSMPVSNSIGVIPILEL